jgi:hypothetical protein
MGLNPRQVAPLDVRAKEFWNSMPGETPDQILATQKPTGKGVDIPADFVRKQDQPAKS